MHVLPRLGIALLALLVGAAVGALTTFAHATTAPWLLLAGLAVAGALVLGVRLAIAQPLATAAAVLGLVGASALLAAFPGDEIVIVADDALGWSWMIGVPVITLAAALWPLPRRTEAASESP